MPVLFIQLEVIQLIVRPSSYWDYHLD